MYFPHHSLYLGIIYYYVIFISVPWYVEGGGSQDCLLAGARMLIQQGPWWLSIFCFYCNFQLQYYSFSKHLKWLALHCRLQFVLHWLSLADPGNHCKGRRVQQRSQGSAQDEDTRAVDHSVEAVMYLKHSVKDFNWSWATITKNSHLTKLNAELTQLG